MQSGIPVATDNIYKFYALFGLLLLLSSMAAFFYVHKSTNEIAYKTYIDLESLKANKNRTVTENVRLEILQKRQEIDKSDRNFYFNVLGFGWGFGFCVMAFGFFRWHGKIQPDLDRMTQLQIKKIELELQALKRRR